MKLNFFFYLPSIPTALKKVSFKVRRFSSGTRPKDAHYKWGILERGRYKYIAIVLALLAVIMTQSSSLAEPLESHIKARLDPLHFKPAIETATNQQCLRCHQEILQRKPRDSTLAGVKSKNSQAWYQTVDTYQGKQDSFHRRHLRHLLRVSDSSPVLMKLNCNTCHQGHNANKEVSSDVHTHYTQPALSKKVDPDICLMCHGEFDYEIMLGVPGPWKQMGDTFNNDCMVCHKIFRTNAHNVNYLNKEIIKQAGTTNGEVCFGCHGGRSWYRIAYPYPRNPWPGMATVTPPWAILRPVQSEPRFLVGMGDTVKKTDAGGHE